MALPIVHGTAGYLIQRHNRTMRTGVWSVLAAVLVANLPDFDFIVGFVLGKPGMFHRGFSHTVLAAVVFGLAAGTCYRLVTKSGWIKATVLFTSLYASHLVVDAFTVDARAPYGGQFLWPLSDAYIISPVPLFGEILVNGSARFPFLQTVFSWSALVQLLREAGLSASAIGVAYLIEMGQQRRKRSRLKGDLGGALSGEARTTVVGDEWLAYSTVEAAVLPVPGEHGPVDLRGER